MGLRLGFAVAAFLEPEVLLVDEVLAVGDLEFRKKCLGRIGEVSREDGRTVVFVSHDLNAILSTCSRSLLVDKGLLVADGPAEDVVAEYESRQSAAAAVGGEFRRSEPHPGFDQPIFLSARLESGDGDGHVAHGQPLRIVIETNSRVAARRFSVDLSIFDRRHRPVAFLSSGVMQGRFFEGGDVVECSIPFLPFVPGYYSIELAARIPGAQALDEWIGDIAFDITRFDPFDVGSTFAANDATGSVVPEHTWSVLSASDKQFE